MREELLDEYWGEEDKTFMRIPTVVKLEKILLVGYIVIVGWTIFKIVPYLLANDGFYIGLWVLTPFLKEALVITIILWWRKASIDYDNQKSEKAFQRPPLLNVLRGVVWAGTIISIGRFLIYLLGDVSFTTGSYILIALVGFVLNILVIRYLLLTNKIEKAIR